MFMLAVIVYFIAAIMYKSGKREGSRKGYHVGIRRRRR
jgi:hypothetical protein